MRRDLSPKERVLGIDINGKSRAYPMSVLRKYKGKTLKDIIGTSKIHIKINREGEILSIKDNKGRDVHHTYLFWFAWQAFHPKTDVYKE